MRRYRNIIFITLFLAILYILHSFTTPSINTFHIDNQGEFTVHYIDVGQGDSILIQVNNKNLLIDAGPQSCSNYLINYLSSLKIKKLDYVIATHPHEDHIGSMDTIIKKFNIGSFYAPKVYSSSKTFENMIDALKSKKLKINSITSDIDINLGANTSFSICSPCSGSYDNLNNYSPIIKIKYKNTSFLFTGDAEKEIENKTISSGNDLKADVLKVAHHGSSTSTTEAFLKKVNPQIAVISVGKNNEFNHPDKITIQHLVKNNVTIYQTSLNGTVVLTSDGTNITKIK